MYDKGEPLSASRALHSFATVPVAAVCVAVAGLLTALSGRYGYHRDELYFLVAGDRPDWGYVDQPPLTPLLTRAFSSVFGDSPAGLRVAGTLACVILVLLVASVVRELGGDRRAQILAAGCAATSTFVLAVGHIVTTATYDLVAWLAIGWLFLRLLRTGNPRWWAPMGAAVGIGVQNKYLVAMLVAALLGGLAVAGPRRLLRSGWLGVGVALAVLIAWPNLWWQEQHGWPQLTVAGGIVADDGTENRLLFVPQQLLFLSPLYAPVCAAGWLRLWRDARVGWARAVAWAYPLLCLQVIGTGGKPYYALPLLLVLLAAGCPPSVAWLAGGARRVRRSVLVGAVTVTAAMSLTVGLPVLPPSQLEWVNGINPEQGEQVGWPEFADAVAAGWRRVPPGERATSVVFTQNYGQAGALVRYGPARGLPAPYSGHMSFADWGPPPDSATGRVVLVRQRGSGGGASRFFRGCQDVGRVDNGAGVENEEQGTAVVVCAGTVSRWSELWPRLRHFY
ncbi:glycosyltransferase family 39 protein [Streptomyces sp. NBC_00237]|uniref:ArnT family glycosyltransferase n=1 Tax=Streptomyces sp. NBC_00237 TaxID=2975687 RepID=UPI00224D1387|nr:glycosyltransferase family 39 protein [Streptomyces sp. NBC_00237]MCX5202357.1 glycosyltransferase family 39 protein [Streptomyces sp. NBC_00237]